MLFGVPDLPGRLFSFHCWCVCFSGRGGLVWSLLISVLFVMVLFVLSAGAAGGGGEGFRIVVMVVVMMRWGGWWWWCFDCISKRFTYVGVLMAEIIIVAYFGMMRMLVRGRVMLNFHASVAFCIHIIISYFLYVCMYVIIEWEVGVYMAESVSVWVSDFVGNNNRCRELCWWL